MSSERRVAALAEDLGRDRVDRDDAVAAALQQRRDPVRVAARIRASSRRPPTSRVLVQDRAHVVVHGAQSRIRASTSDRSRGVADGERLPVVVEVDDSGASAASATTRSRQLRELGLAVVAAPAAMRRSAAARSPSRWSASTAATGARGWSPIARPTPCQRSMSSTVAVNQLGWRNSKQWRAAARREDLVERGGQPILVARNPLGELPQHRAELRRVPPAARSPRRSAPMPCAHVAQPLHVRQVLAGLDGEDEVGRRVAHPARDRLRAASR